MSCSRRSLPPILFWQLMQTTLPAIAWWGAFVGALFLGGACAGQLAAWAGRRFTGEWPLGGRLGDPGRLGGPIMAALAATYLLLLWRLGPSSWAAIGWFWACVVWGFGGLFTGIFVFGISVDSTEPRPGKGDGRRIPREVYLRSRGLGFVAVVVTGLLLSGIAPLPWPEWQVWAFTDVLSLLIFVLGGPMTVSSRLTPAWLSQDPTRRSSAPWTRRVRDLGARVSSAERDWEAAAVIAVTSVVSRHLNEATNPPFSTVLPKVDRSGLGLMRAGDRVVATAAFTRLRSLTAGISGGAIGVAGPRGAGKSTLLDAFQAGKFLGPGQQHIALVESVPVRYDAREFVLHLFARICREVIRFCDERADDQPNRWRTWLARWRGAGPLLATAAAWVVVGFVGSSAINGPRPDFGTWLATMWWPLVVVFGAASLTYLARRRRPPAVPPPPAITVAPGDLHALHDLARHTLDGIEFQQKHTSGWSGKLSLLFGAETGLTDSRERTRQPRSYQQIVHELSEFLRTTITGLSTVTNIATP